MASSSQEERRQPSKEKSKSLLVFKKKKVNMVWGVHRPRQISDVDRVQECVSLVGSLAVMEFRRLEKRTGS